MRFSVDHNGQQLPSFDKTKTHVFTCGGSVVYKSYAMMTHYISRFFYSRTTLLSYLWQEYKTNNSTCIFTQIKLDKNEYQ